MSIYSLRHLGKAREKLSLSLGVLAEKSSVDIARIKELESGGKASKKELNALSSAMEAPPSIIRGPSSLLIFLVFTLLCIVPLLLPPLLSLGLNWYGKNYLGDSPHVAYCVSLFISALFTISPTLALFKLSGGLSMYIGEKSYLNLEKAKIKIILLLISMALINVYTGSFSPLVQISELVK
tara:strand:- start:2036 stop:2578 length:543 start_codon:yes stop_codon:yes gene_type:complete